MSLFCCSDFKPYKNIRTDYEAHFDAFLSWATGSGRQAAANVPADGFVVQFVKQRNYGPLEAKKYFKRTSSGFESTDEDFVISNNLFKKNTFKNFKCGTHDKFYELNLYTRSSDNKHHWRADVERPGSQIDALSR